MHRTTHVPVPASPPPQQHQQQLATLYRPSWFVSRGNGVLVPVVAVDELPPEIRLPSAPRTITSDYARGLEYLGERPRCGELAYELVRAEAATKEEKKPYMAPDAAVRKKLGMAGDGEKAGEKDIKATTTTNPDTTRTSRPLPPSGIEPDPSRKQYCTYWIRNGTCDYMQQGCRYKHEMPDRDTLRRIGIPRTPHWYVEQRSAAASVQRTGMPGRLGNHSVEPAPVPARPTWLQLRVKAEERMERERGREREREASVLLPPRTPLGPKEEEALIDLGSEEPVVGAGADFAMNRRGSVSASACLSTTSSPLFTPTEAPGKKPLSALTTGVGTLAQPLKFIQYFPAETQEQQQQQQQQEQVHENVSRRPQTEPQKAAAATTATYATNTTTNGGSGIRGLAPRPTPTGLRASRWAEPSLAPASAKASVKAAADTEPDAGSDAESETRGYTSDVTTIYDDSDIDVDIDANADADMAVPSTRPFASSGFVPSGFAAAAASASASPSFEPGSDDGGDDDDDDDEENDDGDVASAIINTPAAGATLRRPRPAAAHGNTANTPKTVKNSGGVPSPAPASASASAAAVAGARNRTNANTAGTMASSKSKRAPRPTSAKPTVPAPTAQPHVAAARAVRFRHVGGAGAGAGTGVRLRTTNGSAVKTTNTTTATATRPSAAAAATATTTSNNSSGKLGRSNGAGAAIGAVSATAAGAKRIRARMHGTKDGRAREVWWTIGAERERGRGMGRVGREGREMQEDQMVKGREARGREGRGVAAAVGVKGEKKRCVGMGTGIGIGIGIGMRK